MTDEQKDRAIERLKQQTDEARDGVTEALAFGYVDIALDRHRRLEDLRGLLFSLEAGEV